MRTTEYGYVYLFHTCSSSRMLCMHRSYILCTAYTIYLFIFVVRSNFFFFSSVYSICFGVVCILPFLGGCLLHSVLLYSLSHVYSCDAMSCCCHLLLMPSIGLKMYRAMRDEERKRDRQRQERNIHQEWIVESSGMQSCIRTNTEQMMRCEWQ